MRILDAVFGNNCPNCGENNSSAARYCQNCGIKLHSDTKSTDYTPEHLREQVLNTRAALEGERKQVTVLFVDIQDSQQLARALSDEAWHRLLDQFFALLNRCIHQNEGTINQYTGDGVMALFGAPIAHEDHAQRACYAALQIKREVNALSHAVKQRHSLQLQTRIGLNSGEVLVGTIGDDLRMDYTAQGATVGLAARMENLAQGGQICLSSATAELVGNKFKLKRLGQHNIKGERDKMQLYELRSVRVTRSRFEHARGQLTPFVGREQLLTELHEHFSNVLAENHSLVYCGIEAEAGLGKSRLCYEFATQCHTQHDALYLEAHGLPQGQHQPLLPIIELTRHYFGIREDDAAELARQRIHKRLKKFGLPSESAVQTIGSFIGLSLPNTADSNHALAQHNPGNTVAIFKLLKKITLVGSTFEPTVIVLDDLHLFDQASLQFINELLTTLAGSKARLMIVANYRPLSKAMQRLVNPFTEQTGHHYLYTLQALDTLSTGHLLDQWLGDDHQLDKLKKQINTRAAGNPLFLEAIIEDLISHEAMTGEFGHYRLIRNIRELRVPATIQALLNARIDRLPETQKHLLQVAAVLGKHLPDRVLYKASNLSFRSFNRAIAGLLDAQLMQRQSIFPQAIYAFMHPLLQESIYQSLLTNQTHELHERVADAAAYHYRQQPEQASMVALHYDRAERIESAIHWYRKAAEWAQQRHIETAKNHWQRIEQLSDNLPEQQAHHIQLEACARILQLGSRRGMTLDEAEKRYKLGHTLAHLSPETHQFSIQAYPQIDYVVLLEMTMGSITAFAGQLHISITHYRRAALQAENDAQRVVAWVGLIYSQHALGQYRQAHATTDQALQLINGNDELGADLLGRSPHLSIQLHQLWLNMEQQASNPSANTALMQQAEHLLQKAKQRQEAEHHAWAHCLLGLASGQNQQHKTAMRHASKASRITRQSGNRLIFIASRDIEMQILASLNDVDNAEATGLAILDFIEQHAIGIAFLPRIHAQLSHIYVVKQQLDLALEQAKKSLTLATQLDTKGYAIEALLCSARVRLHYLERPKAKQQVQTWLQTAEQLMIETGLSHYQSAITDIQQTLLKNS